MVMFLSAFVCGVASARLPVQRAAGGRSRGGGGRRADGAVRADRADHRAAVGAQGVGRLVAVGRAADLGAAALADLRRLPAAARTAARAPRSCGRRRALRHGQRAVRLHVGEHAGAPCTRRRRVVPTLPPAMRGPFWFCVAAFLLLYVLLLAAARAARAPAGRSWSGCTSPPTKDERRCCVAVRVDSAAAALRWPRCASRSRWPRRSSPQAQQPPHRRRRRTASCRSTSCRRRSSCRRRRSSIGGLRVRRGSCCVGYLWSCGAGWRRCEREMLDRLDARRRAGRRRWTAAMQASRRTSSSSRRAAGRDRDRLDARLARRARRVRRGTEAAEERAAKGSRASSAARPIEPIEPIPPVAFTVRLPAVVASISGSPAATNPRLRASRSDTRTR